MQSTTRNLLSLAVIPLCVLALVASACSSSTGVVGADAATAADGGGATGDAAGGDGTGGSTDGTAAGDGQGDDGADGPDADEPLLDTDEPTPDADEPTPDADEPVEDVGDPGCEPGTVSCEEGWVVVCAPGGEEWTQILDCGEAAPCFEGACCSLSCDGAACGDDGCGGTCGDCGDDEMCSDGACVCAPACDGKDCGDDGCGGECGVCEGDDVCDGGLCVCIPTCGDAMCGDDGCGGSCGECAADNVCTEGVCVGPCTPGETRCNGQAVEVCNPDGESWMAVATCAADAPCYQGACCEPMCDGISCGDDGCGGSCGQCDGLDVCVEGACLPGCDEPGTTGCDGDMVTLCSADGIQEPLLDCWELGQNCEEGECVEPVVPPADCPEVCVGATIEAALCALDICYEDFFQGAEISSPTGSDVTGAWEAMAQYGDTDNGLTPQAPPSYLALGTGDLHDQAHQNWLPGSTSTADPFSSDGYTISDAVEFTLTLTAPPSVTGFSLDSLFMSVEYEEWIGTSFNDKLYLLVDAPESTGGEQKVINYAACTNPDGYSDFENADGKWCYIAINTAYSEPCDAWTTDLAGTGFSCPDGSSTGWLRTTHPIVPGESFTLTLHIHDTSDQAYDSAALCDNFQWLTGDVVHETVPIAPADCIPACGDATCGSDGCEGSCGECADGAYCDAGQCAPATACEGGNPAGCKESGCPDGQVCDTSGQGNVCVPSSCWCDPATGEWSCTEDCGGGVCVTPTEFGIRVEVVWDTPGDEDQTDTGPEAGADLDLHFTHPFATGDDGLGWFDQPFDCFWFNANPSWGSLDPSIDDDPEMVLDDTDGAGPEIMALTLPQDDHTYRVGVHTWDDHDYGLSLATVQIYINGILTKEIPEDGPGVALEHHDMWEVATIDWPSGEVTVLQTDSGGMVILQDYLSPWF